MSLVLRNKYFYPFLLCRTLTVSMFSFFFGSYTISRTPWTSDRLVARPLPKYRTIETQIKCTHTHPHTHTHTHTHQTSMPEVGLESMITASKRTKTVNASDRSATVTGPVLCRLCEDSLCLVNEDTNEMAAK
jgi:hypothetical protein